MKISFSTLGCPGWSWEDMLSTAKDIGFDGIELRGIGQELYVPKAVPFIQANINNTIKRLRDLKFKIPCITSACYLFDIKNIDAHMKEGYEYIDFAASIGTPFIRVLGDANPQPGSNIDLDFVAKNLNKLGTYAKSKNVKVLIETNGVLADSRVMLDLIEKVNNEGVAVLWDVHHPYRYFNEQIETTYARLGKYIEHVHVKDSVMVNDRPVYKMMGHGDVPVSKAVKLLKDNGYNGFISLEWVKRWCMELEEPGIVFSHYCNFMRTL